MGVTLTAALGDSLPNSAIVSWVRMWVCVSMVRCLLISSSERVLGGWEKERLSAAPTRPAQAPVSPRTLGYKRSPLPCGSPMDSATNQTRARELRLEDNALVRGAGRFVDDARFPNQAFAVFVRSPHAFARIVSIDTTTAHASKGVLAVLTAADMNEAGLKTAGRHPPLKGRGGKE